ARPEAGNRLKGKHHIISGGLVRRQSQLTVQPLKDRDGFTHMTGSAVTHFDHKPSLRLEGKILIKRCYAVCLCFRNAKLPSHIVEKLRRKVAVFRLDVLDDRDQ